MRRIPKRYIRPIPLPKKKMAPANEQLNLDLSTATTRRLRYTYSTDEGPWDRLGNALFLAGGAYPLLLWAIAVVIGAVGICFAACWGEWEGVLSAPVFLAGSFLAALMAGCFTLFYAGVVTVFALLVVFAVVRLLRINHRWEGVGTFSGSFVAFLCFFLPILGFSELDAGEYLRAWPAILLGPVLGIAWGMLVGAYTGIGNNRIYSPEGAGSGRLRFSILQIMMLMLVTSVVFAVLRVAHLLNSALLMSAGVWLACLLVFYYPATRLARRQHRRRARKYLRYRMRRLSARRLQSQPLQAAEATGAPSYGCPACRFHVKRTIAQ